VTHPTPEPAGDTRSAADRGLLAWIRDYAQPETAAMNDEQALIFARQVQADHLGYTAEALDRSGVRATVNTTPLDRGWRPGYSQEPDGTWIETGAQGERRIVRDPGELAYLSRTADPGAAPTAGPGTSPRPGETVRVLYDDGSHADGVWVLDDDGVPGVRDDGGVRALDPGVGVVGWQVVGAADGQALLRHPDADDPDHQPHPQELSDAYDRDGDVPAGLTYSQYVAWATGPGLPADVLDAAAAEHDQTVTVLDWWDTHDAVLADLAEPARTQHPDITAEMDDEQAATWYAHHDPAGVPALVEPAHLHAAIDTALAPEDALTPEAAPVVVLTDEASLIPADALERFLDDPGDGFGLDA
jgi:hypothetical protein